MITEGLGLLGVIAIGGGVAVNLRADGKAMEVQLPADLALAHAQVIVGVKLLSLGQLSVFHALHHFGRWAEKGAGADLPASTVRPKVLQLFYESRVSLLLCLEPSAKEDER